MTVGLRKGIFAGGIELLRPLRLITAVMRGSLSPFGGTWARQEIFDAMYPASRGRDRAPIGKRLWRAIGGSRSEV